MRLLYYLESQLVFHFNGPRRVINWNAYTHFVYSFLMIEKIKQKAYLSLPTTYTTDYNNLLCSIKILYGHKRYCDF